MGQIVKIMEDRSQKRIRQNPSTKAKLSAGQPVKKNLLLIGGF
jgi:hypothetical protein